VGEGRADKKGVALSRESAYNKVLKIRDCKMSTELRDVPDTEISQTRFAGGIERGACIQLTRNVDQFIQLDRAQALAVAQELILFANKQEVVDHDLRLLGDENN
jgi:hypothetical protein